MAFVHKFDVYTFDGNPSSAILMFFYAATTRPTTWGREDSMEGIMSQKEQGNYSLRRPPKLIIPQAVIRH